MELLKSLTENLGVNDDQAKGGDTIKNLLGGVLK